MQPYSKLQGAIGCQDCRCYLSGWIPNGRNENWIGRLFQASCMDAGYFNFEIWDDIMIIKRATLLEDAGAATCPVVSSSGNGS